MDRIIKQAHDAGYVETITGRRRYLRDINSRNYTLRSYAERNAINAPIQGTAADIMKVAMLDVDEGLKASKLGAKMLLQVHDELVFDVHKKEMDALLHEKIAEFRKNMTPRELEIFDSRIFSDSPSTLQEIGDRYGISRERVRQIKEKAIRRLKHTSRSKLLKAYLGE